MGVRPMMLNKQTLLLLVIAPWLLIAPLAPLAGGNVPAPNGHLLAAEGPAPVPGANFPAADCHIPAADFPAAGDQPLAASGYPANAFMPQLVMLPPPVTIDVFYCGMEEMG